MKITEQVQFTTRDDFREWLGGNCQVVQGIWLVFGKKGGPKTVSAGEALEEALCFGWIDGQMQSIDETMYVKYFAQRRNDSKWSEKNKSLVESLEKQGRMTDHGRSKIEEAKRRGTWDAPKPQPVTDEDVSIFAEALKDTEPAYTNFLGMSPSVQRAYAGGYRSVVSDEAKARCLARSIERLNNNLKPM